MKLEEIAIFTDIVKETASFYLNLGGKAGYQNDGMAIIQFENVKILIHSTYQPGEDDLPCENHIAFGSADVDQDAQRLAESGTAMLYEPKDYDWGRSAYLRDPNGRLVELAEVG